MRNDRRKQIMTLSILVVGVLVLSIGFAAFSSILNISSTATYTPESDVFKIKFSKSSNSIIDGTNNPVSPVSGNGGSATITNDGTPKISKLQANFTSPGQSVVYEFYAVNETPYDAYLTTINYLNITGKTTTKECTGSNGATPSLVSKACEGINVLVEVGTTTANKTTTVNNHTLGKNSSEKVKVTIEYTGQAIDGSMNVTFGDISLIYSTAQGSGGTTGTSSVCTLADADSDGVADTSEVVTCTNGDISESFYVIETVSGNVNMLAAYNITLSLTNPLQDPTDTTSPAKNPIAFASTDYWSSGGYSPAGDSEYDYVYDSNSNLYPYVEAYRNVLEGIGVEVIDAKLMSFEQATALGYYTSNSSVPSWVYTSTYWLGSFKEYDFEGDGWVWGISLGEYYFTDYIYGIRPVITIAESDLG